MSESAFSYLIAAGTLIVLALFVPCMESLARLLRRKRQEGNAIPMRPEERAYERDIA